MTTASHTASHTTSPPAVEVLPLSPLQAGLLFHAVAGDGSLDVYSMQSTYRFAPGTDLAVLRSACAALLERHGALRAGFSAALLDRPVQFVPAAVPLPWREVVSDPADDAAAQAELSALQRRERERRFDVDRPPLVRFVGLDLGTHGVHLLVTNHHLVLDGWSDALLVVELLRHVRAGGRDTTLPPAPQFREFLGWLAGRDAEADRAAWRRALGGLTAGTTVAEPSAVREQVLPDVVERDLPGDLTDRLITTARAAAVSVSTVCSTVWALVLRSLTGADDVVFGQTVSGRPPELPGVDETVGLFLNTVPHRVRLDPALDVTALLQRVHRESGALVENHHVGLGDVQRDAGVGPLFDTLYVMRNTPEDDAAFAELAAATGLADVEGGDATHYPLTFVVHPGEPYRFILSHAPDVFPAAAAEDLLERAVRVLEAVTADPHRLLGTVPTLDPASAGDLVASWAGDHRALPADSLTARLARTAARFPDRTALVDDDVALDFGRLWAAVVVQAEALRRDGVRPGDLVGVELPRGVRTVVALLAVLAAGAAYVPVDPSHPAERRARVLRRAGVVTTLDTSTASPLPGPGARSSATAEELHPAYRHDDLAYVMFTSGSTGDPKGVQVEHRGLVNMAENHRRRIFEPAGAVPGGEPWRVAHAVSFAFDMSWEELLWLLDGHEVHLLSEDVRRDPALMAALVDRRRVDVLNVTPSVASALLAEGLLDAGRHRPRLVLLGGEAVGPDVWDALRDTPGTEGYNLYGPTEYTINTLGGGTADSATPTVGRPVDGTDVRVLDTSLQPVPDGVPGELWVSGAGLARGYHDAPALTAERFVADPWGPPGRRMYRTGDVVSRRPDGGFDFHGRSDTQVKVRGFRVEPGEVAAVVARDELVARAAVVVRPAPGGNPVLVGYVVPAVPDLAGRLGEVTERLRAQLPEHMVPAALVVVADLPLTVNSKLDLGALPVPDLSATGRAPRTAEEETVCAAFAEVLGLPRFGADDDFHTAGGHSLLAMRLAALLTDRLGTRVGVAAVLGNPTPAGLLAALHRPQADPWGPVLPLGGRDRARGTVVCVPPLLGLGWTFAALAARLPGGQRVLALQSPALAADPAEVAALPTTLEGLADLLVPHVLAGTDGEPVHLVGFSFGAHLAHVLASRLEERGVDLVSLTLLDPGAPGGALPAGVEVGEPVGADQEALEYLLTLSLRDRPDWLTRPYEPDDVLEFLAEGNGVLAGFGRAELDRVVRSAVHSASVPGPVEHRPVTVPVLLVASTAPGHRTGHVPTAADLEAERAAWQPLCRRPVQLATVDVVHTAITSPAGSDQVARLLTPFAAAALARRTTPEETP
ncbi:amino acid adenylation domain-containing protein [Kineococcus sp. TBRC 1896]|uniref:Amino acid adenylation domain-containing protein n=1 Tax=Kineococcus mangrovi TaxID=1660183 RepID=A0ABV4I4N0_9ACTN